MSGAEIANVPNPRAEDNESDLHVVNEGFLSHGVEPVTLDGGLMEEVVDVANKYRDRCDVSKIQCVLYWNSTRNAAVGAVG